MHHHEKTVYCIFFLIFVFGYYFARCGKVAPKQGRDLGGFAFWVCGAIVYFIYLNL